MSIEQAYEILERSIIYYRGEPVGTAAACDPKPVAANYEECFVRDFVSAALVFLLNGRPEIVRNFLDTVMQLRGRQQVQRGHRGSSGLMPASFRVNAAGDGLDADFGDRAIGRVVPVDSAMWWMFLLRAYVVATGDWDYAHQPDVQICYWIDRRRLNEIHRFHSEEFGPDVANVLNVYPESIPDWMDGWLDAQAGYLAGNQGPGRVDFRFFSQGNLLAVLFGVANAREGAAIMHLFELHWDALIGEMPLKIVYPAVAGKGQNATMASAAI